jgi:hypothetical protein
MFTFIELAVLGVLDVLALQRPLFAKQIPELFLILLLCFKKIPLKSNHGWNP